MVDYLFYVLLELIIEFNLCNNLFTGPPPRFSFSYIPILYFYYFLIFYTILLYYIILYYIFILLMPIREYNYIASNYYY